jgi:hypothetical protein
MSTQHINTIKAPIINIRILDDKELELVSRPAVFYVKDGNLFCSDIDACDYDCEIRGPLFITPELELWAKENDGYWEWENTDTIVFSPHSETQFTL